MTVRIENQTRGRPLAARAAVADRLGARLRGLIGRPPLGDGEALILRPCSGVHTCFMRQTIDVALLDGDGRVVMTAHRLRPWRLTRIVPEARVAVELPPGTLERTGTAVGDRVVIDGE